MGEARVPNSQPARHPQKIHEGGGDVKQRENELHRLDEQGTEPQQRIFAHTQQSPRPVPPVRKQGTKSPR